MGVKVADLLIGMGADVARLRRDMATAKQVVVPAVQEIQTIANQARNALGAIGVGLGLHEAVGYIKETVSALDDLDERAQGLGILPERLSALELTFKAAGVESGKFEGGIGKLSTKISEAISGNKVAVEQFRLLGVEFKDVNGNARNTVDVLNSLAGSFASYRDDVNKTAASRELLGKTGTKFIAALNGGTDSLERFGGVARQDIDDAARFAAALDKVSAAAEKSKGALGGAVSRTFGPALERLLAASENAEKTLGDRKTTGLFTNIGNDLFVFQQLTKDADELTDAIAGVNGELEEQKEYIEFLATIGLTKYSQSQTAVLDNLAKRLQFLRAQRDTLGTGNKNDNAPGENTQKLGPAPNLNVNTEGMSFLETLKKQVDQLQRGEFYMLRQQAAEKKVGGEAEKFILALEAAKQLQTDLAYSVELDKQREAQEKQVQSVDDYVRGLSDEAQALELQNNLYGESTVSIDQQTRAYQANLKALQAIRGINLPDDQKKQAELINKVLNDTANAIQRVNEALENGARKKATDEAFDFTRSLNDEMAQLVFEGQQMGKNTEEITKATRARDLLNRATATVRNIDTGDRAEDARRANAVYKETQEAIEALDKETDRQTAKAKDFAFGWEKAFKDFADAANNGAQAARDIFTTVVSGMEDLLVEFVHTGQLNFKQLVDTILTELLRIQFRKFIANEGQDFLKFIGLLSNSATGGGGGGESFTGVGASPYKATTPAVKVSSDERAMATASKQWSDFTAKVTSAGSGIQEGLRGRLESQRATLMRNTWDTPVMAKRASAPRESDWATGPKAQRNRPTVEVHYHGLQIGSGVSRTEVGAALEESRRITIAQVQDFAERRIIQLQDR